MDEPWGDGSGGEFVPPVVETGEEVGGDGFAGFDFDRVEGVGCGFDKLDKALEGGEILDVENLADVAFEVGADVMAICIAR